MTVNRKVTSAVVLPFVLVINPNADQVRHHLRKAVVVVPFDPNDFNMTLGIRELADVAKKTPVFFLEPAEIQIGKDVAQKDQPVERRGLQHSQSLRGAAHLRAEVKVGKNDCVSEDHVT